MTVIGESFVVWAFLLPTADVADGANVPFSLGFDGARWLYRHFSGFRYERQICSRGVRGVDLNRCVQVKVVQAVPCRRSQNSDWPCRVSKERFREEYPRKNVEAVYHKEWK